MMGSDQSQHRREKQQPNEGWRLRFLEAALACSADGVILVDTTGELVFMNEVAHRLFYQAPAPQPPAKQAQRYQLRYLDGQPVAPEGTPASKALRGETLCGIELIVAKPEGGDTYLSTTASPIRDEHGTIQGAVVVVRDVTERKESERKLLETASELEKSLTLLDTLLGTAPVGFGFLDKELRYVRVNNRLAEINGLPAGQHIGRTMQEVVPNLALTQAELLQRVIETGQPDVDIEVSGETPAASGQQRHWLASYYPVRSRDGDILGVGGVVVEITERKRAEEALRIYSRITQNSPDLICVIDREYHYRMVNPTLSRMFGVAAEDIIGQTPVHLVGREAFEKVERPQLDRCFQGQPTHFEGWFEFPVAGRRYMEGHYYPLFDNGQVEYAVALARDVTERKRAEAFREQYVSLISHDLRAPLTIMLGQADWLRRLLLRKELAQEARGAEAIVKSGRRMNLMLEELVESARLEAGRLELHKRPTDLLQLVSDSLERIVAFEDRARIQIEYPEWVPPVFADPNQIERAIANFVTNALKYSPADRPVTIRIDRRSDEAVVAVADRGVGIPPEDLPRMFQRFFRSRTGKRAEGLGLGLYITRLIVEAHSGRTWVESEVGKGSTFHLALPLLR